VRVRLEFVPQDLWVGAYWRISDPDLGHARRRRVDVWLCLLPCLPLRLTWFYEVAP
jgi:hypothetical protein